MKGDRALREELIALLRGGNAHMDFDEAVKGFPLDQINSPVPNGIRPPGDVPFTPWHLLEHMRIAQWDILEFVLNPRHVSPTFPEGFWPEPREQADRDDWEKTIHGFRSDLNSVVALVEDAAMELLSPLPHATEYVLVREILLVADHNGYHLGQFAVLRDVMGTWP